ncbi:MAG: GldG family protein [Deltaproteobacteria bacterium]|nr:GldG family protein [Deltaproteobacteria bacterium]
MSGRARQSPSARPGWLGSTRALRVSSAVGLAAALAIAVLVNVLSSRHYRRWDWTADRLFTLGAASVEAVRALREPTEIFVLLPAADPLTASVRQLLASYQEHTDLLRLRFADPDTHPAEFLAVQQRFGVGAGRGDDGEIVPDAAIVVAGAGRHIFVPAEQLVALEEQGQRARPRVEQALTAALRAHAAGQRPQICFASGHGEPSLDVELGPLRRALQARNYDPVPLPPLAALERADPLPRCRALVVAGPTRPLGPEEAARVRSYLAGGGGALFALGPVPDPASDRTLDLGLGPVLELIGVRANADLVIETTPSRRAAHGAGEIFMAQARPHAVTEPLLRLARQGMDVVLQLAGSLSLARDAAAASAPLLETSPSAFSVADLGRFSQHGAAPERQAGDRAGPLVVAYASELPPGARGAPRGGRAIVIGSASVVHPALWQVPELRGGALFVESAIAWLAGTAPPPDVPERTSRAVGWRMTEESLAAVLRYGVLYAPGAALLAGLAVRWRRRATERRSSTKPPPAAPSGREEARP